MVIVTLLIYFTYTLPCLTLSWSQTEVMRCEFERVAAWQPMDTLNMQLSRGSV